MRSPGTPALKKKQRVGECGSAFKIACFLKEEVIKLPGVNSLREPGARTRTDVISPARGYYFYLNFKGTFCTRELPLDKKVGYSLDYSGLAAP